MSITGELREYARHLHNVWYDPRGNVYTYTTMDNAPSLDAVSLDEHVLAIADRIDEQNAEAQRRWMAELDAARDRDGFIELPKDADGEAIHIGDVMEFSRFEIDCPVTREVDGIGQGVFFAWCGERGYEQLNADSYRHHHHKQPTVEDVLRDMYAKLDEVTALYVGEVIDSDERDRDEACIFAEFAAKLRLAGEDE